MSPNPPPAGARRGQAAVELLALVPALALCLALAWQALVAVHAWGLAGDAARAGARARQVGAPPGAAALAVLPGAWARGAGASLVPAAGDRGERVRVRIRVPGVLPWPGSPAEVRAEALSGPERR